MCDFRTKSQVTDKNRSHPSDFVLLACGIIQCCGARVTSSLICFFLASNLDLTLWACTFVFLYLNNTLPAFPSPQRQVSLVNTCYIRAVSGTFEWWSTARKGSEWGKMCAEACERVTLSCSNTAVPQCAKWNSPASAEVWCGEFFWHFTISGGGCNLTQKPQEWSNRPNVLVSKILWNAIHTPYTSAWAHFIHRPLNFPLTEFKSIYSARSGANRDWQPDLTDWQGQILSSESAGSEHRSRFACQTGYSRGGAGWLLMLERCGARWTKNRNRCRVEQ